MLLYLDTAATARLSIEKANRSIATLQKQKCQLELEVEKLSKQYLEKQVAIQKADELMEQKMADQKKADIPNLEKEVLQLREKREQLLVEQARSDIRELRERLIEGKPCPVCGSLHHPVLQGAEDTLSPDLYKRQIAEMTLRLQQLTGQIAAYNDLQKQLGMLQQQQLVLHKSLTETENLRADNLACQKVLLSQIEHEEKVVKEQTEQLSGAFKGANTLFGNDTWQSGWQQNPEVFRQTLDGFARQWQEKGERLLELQRLEGAWKAECDSLASFLPDLQKMSEEAGSLYKQHLSTVTSLQEERRKWCSGRPADEVEREFNRFIEGLKERLKQLQTVQNEESVVVEQSKGVVEQITKDMAELDAQLSVRMEALEKWKQQWKTASPDQSLDEAMHLIGQQQSEISFRIRSQEENRKKVAGLQEELNCRREVSERWAKLNELAGSADGAKFRRIAQGYTLDVLLSYTNVQLRNLTRRYRLERVPDTLALQVIDQDMCDEIRTVHSLSGGESFLVSLALALGLSSLSSNRMKVESLFIDEGFGSLDAETLKIAMDALENLRTQGRKIGVISHVQEMTERIPVQIRVNRSGNGRSTIEITGGGTVA